MCIRKTIPINSFENVIDRNERTRIMRDLHTYHDSVMSILNTFSNDDGDSLVSYDELSSLEFYKWYIVGNGVRFMRLEHDKKPVFFVTEMIPKKQLNNKASFGVQSHDCKEIVNILEGELIEAMECGKRYEKGDIVIYPTNFLHKPYATVFSKYEVEFIKNRYENNRKF